VLDIRPEFDAHCGTTVHLASEHTFARVNPYHVKEKGTITLIQECVGRYARHCGVWWHSRGSTLARTCSPACLSVTAMHHSICVSHTKSLESSMIFYSKERKSYFERSRTYSKIRRA